MNRHGQLYVWIQNVLPQVYDDSLSYYEVLGKVTAALNEIAKEVDSIESVTEEVVTEVITQMVADGELADLINPELQNEIDGVSDRVDDLEDAVDDLEEAILHPYVNKFCVVGDSWSDPALEQNTWMQTFKDCTGWNLLHNYAINAAGFIAHDPNLISNQIEAFIQSDYLDKTDFLIMVGGINDYRNGVTRVDLRVEILRIITRLKAVGYTGKIVYAPNYQYPYDYEQMTYFGMLCAQVGAHCITINTFGILGEAWFNTSNYFHLTQYGSEVFGEMLASYLGFGNFSPEKVHASIEGVANFEYNYNNRSVTVMAEVLMPSGETSVSWTAEDAALIPWIKKSILIGTVGRSYKRFILQIDATGAGSMVTEEAPNANTYVRFSWTYSA